MIKNLNLALRFGLELCALGTLAYWGSRIGAGPVLKVGLGIGLPVLTAVFWGAFVSPKARFGGSRARRLLLGLLVLTTAAGALATLGHVRLGLIYGAVAAVNTALTYAWGPQPGETSTT